MCLRARVGICFRLPERSTPEPDNYTPRQAVSIPQPWLRQLQATVPGLSACFSWLPRSSPRLPGTQHHLRQRRRGGGPEQPGRPAAPGARGARPSVLPGCRVRTLLLSPGSILRAHRRSWRQHALHAPVCCCSAAYKRCRCLQVTCLGSTGGLQCVLHAAHTSVPRTSVACSFFNLPAWHVRPLLEQRLAGTATHVASMRLRQRAHITFSGSISVQPFA